MKKIINKFAFLLGGIIILSSCESNDIPTIDENGPTLAQFGTTSLVMGTPEEGATREVEVIVTNTSASERSIDINIDPESTATAEQYSISDLVIPAGSYTGTITISTFYDALPESGSSELVVNLESVNGGETLIDNGALEIEMFRKCPIVLENLVGTWTGTDSWGYPTQVEIAMNENGELTINGLLFEWTTGWWGEVIITNDPVVMDVNLDTEEISIEEQFYMTTTWDGAPQPLYNLTGSGVVLNACENVMQINPTLMQPDGYGAIDGSAWGPAFSVVLTKQ